MTEHPSNDTNPSFRFDHVGSLLRPAPVIDARIKCESGTISKGDLRAIEDDAIASVIKKQRDVGLEAVTDGEFRRAYWHYDFLGALNGMKLERIVNRGAPSTAGFVHMHRLEVTGPISWRAHPFLDDFNFVASHSSGAIAKQTIPSPSVIHFRLGQQAVTAGAYTDLDELQTDLTKTYSDAIAAFSGAGCQYLQLDEVNLAMLCDQEQVAQAKARGVYRDDIIQIYTDMINAAVQNKSPEMKIGMHLCRGNFQSTWIASGGYEPVAEALFNDINVDAYFMEFDSDRAGGFEPLRFLPKGNKRVVLGLVTSKHAALEGADDVKRMIEKAARFAPIEQLALSPQCGFASTEEGNKLKEDEQWRKLRLCVEVSKAVWGH